jgi:hypothetical protein
VVLRSFCIAAASESNEETPELDDGIASFSTTRVLCGKATLIAQNVKPKSGVCTRLLQLQERSAALQLFSPTPRVPAFNSFIRTPRHAKHINHYRRITFSRATGSSIGSGIDTLKNGVEKRRCCARSCKKPRA